MNILVDVSVFKWRIYCFENRWNFVTVWWVFLEHCSNVSLELLGGVTHSWRQLGFTCLTSVWAHLNLELPAVCLHHEYHRLCHWAVHLWLHEYVIKKSNTECFHVALYLSVRRKWANVCLNPKIKTLKVYGSTKATLHVFELENLKLLNILIWKCK